MQKKLYHNSKSKSNNNCPTCGFHVSYSHSFESMLAGEFVNDANGEYVAFRSTPTRASTIEADVLVPLAQSLVWSFVSILPAIPIAYWLRYEWYFPFAIGSVSLLISWLSAQKKSENSLALIEEFSYSPIAENDEINPGALSRRHLQLEITDKTERSAIRMQFVDLPASIDIEKFDKFCQGVVSGKSLSRRNWTPERILFSRDQYDVVIAKLVTGGILHDVEGKGKTLTRGGKHALERYVQEVENSGKIAEN